MWKWCGVVVLLVLTSGCGRFGFQQSDASGDDGGSDADADAGGRAGGLSYAGGVIFFEGFEDDAFAERDWFDGANGAAGPGSPAAASAASFACTLPAESSMCAAGDLGRHNFAPTEAIYVSWWVRYPDGYTGATELWLFTTADREYIGGSDSRLGVMLGLDPDAAGVTFNDHSYVDPSCAQLSNGTIIGCDGGTVEGYAFSEMRSVCGCNGVVGDLRRWQCTGGEGSFWTTCSWDTSPDALLDGDWHFVEAFLRMNSIVDGKGLPDGSIRYWVDGELRIETDEVLMRTGAFPDLAFDQLMFRPFRRGSGSAEQMLWIDDLTVARGQMP